MLCTSVLCTSGRTVGGLQPTHLTNPRAPLNQPSFAHPPSCLLRYSVMPEALEKWPVAVMQKLLPRHMQLIEQINDSWLASVKVRAWAVPGSRAVVRVQLQPQHLRTVLSRGPSLPCKRCNPTATPPQLNRLALLCRTTPPARAPSYRPQRRRSARPLPLLPRCAELRGPGASSPVWDDALGSLL